MFEGCNYKMAAHTIAHRWALRRSFRRKVSLEEECDYSYGCSSNYLAGTDLESCSLSSPLASAVMAGSSDVSAVRFLHSVTRGTLVLKLHDWVLLQQGEVSVIGQITEMALVRRVSGFVGVRLWACGVQPHCQLHEDDDGMVRMRKDAQTGSVLVDFDTVAVIQMHCVDRAHRREFRYVF